MRSVAHYILRQKFRKCRTYGLTGLADFDRRVTDRTLAVRQHPLRPFQIFRHVDIHGIVGVNCKAANVVAEESVSFHQDIATRHVDRTLSVESWRQLLPTRNRVRFPAKEADAPVGVAPGVGGLQADNRPSNRLPRKISQKVLNSCISNNYELILLL